MKYLSLVFCLAVLLASCGECESDIKCSIPSMALKLDDFPKQDIDTVILNSYVPNGKFDTLVQSHTYDSTGLTLRVSTYVNGSPEFYSSNLSLSTEVLYDWEVILPAIDRRCRISDIIVEGNEYEHKKHNCNEEDYYHPCYRYIISYKRDGETKTLKKNEYAFESMRQ